MKSLAYGGLTVEFDTRGGEKAAQLGVDQHPEGGETPSGGMGTGIKPERFLEAAEQAEILEDIRLAQLMTDDPMAYEQEMIDANLNPRVVNGQDEDGRGPKPALR